MRLGEVPLGREKWDGYVIASEPLLAWTLPIRRGESEIKTVGRVGEDGEGGAVSSAAFSPPEAAWKNFAPSFGVGEIVFWGFVRLPVGVAFLAVAGKIRAHPRGVVVLRDFERWLSVGFTRGRAVASDFGWRVRVVNVDRCASNRKQNGNRKRAS